MKAVQEQLWYNDRFMLKSISLIYYYLSLKSTGGCPSPINYTVSDITNSDVSYTATGLDPYSHYVVKVVAINGEGEGHPVNKTVRTDEEGTKLQFLSWNFEVHSVQIHAIILKHVPKTSFFLIPSRISYINLIKYLTCYVTNNWISEYIFFYNGFVSLLIPL